MQNTSGLHYSQVSPSYNVDPARAYREKQQTKSGLNGLDSYYPILSLILMSF